MLFLTAFEWLWFCNNYVHMHFDSISFMHSSLVSIRELINVITSNYRLVDDNFISPANFVHVTNISWYILESIKCLSHLLINIYFIFSIVSISLHSDNSLIWWQLKIIRSWWEIDVSYVGPEKFFSTTLCGAFSLVFWFCIFDRSLWVFPSHGFHILCHLSSIIFLVLFLIFVFSFLLV